MSICDELISARKCGRVHCGISAQVSPSISELAIEFELDGDLSKYYMIDKTSALQLLELVLKQDMAYGAEIMTANHAADLAGRFLTQFGDIGVGYYTNVEFHEPLGAGSGISWNPVTSATFDMGVLVMGIRVSGCLWIEDED